MNDSTYNWIDNSTYAWVPILVFVVFLVIGAVVGIFKGWKSALYYLAWDVAALIVAVFATKPFLMAVLANVNTSSGNIDIKTFLLSHKATMPIVMSFWFILVKPIAFLVKLPFRKSLMVQKDAPMRTRYWGAAISLVGALPVTAFSANAFTVISGKNFFSPASDGLIKGFTFGQYEGISDYVTDIKAALQTAQDKELQQKLEDLFNGQADYANEPLSAEDRATVEKLLNGNFSQSILESASGTFKDKLLEVGKNGLPGKPEDQGENKFNIETAKWNNIKQVLIDKYGWDENTDLSAIAKNYLVLK